MRIATANSYASTVSSLQKRQEELSNVQEQMTSGLRISKPSDDPAGISRAERARVEVSRGKQLLRTVEASRAVITQGESALGNAGDLVQTAREALVAAGNGTYSAGDRKTLAEQLKQLRGQLLSVANQQDGSGHYLFGGQGATTAPFVDGVGGVDWWQGSATAAGFSDGQVNASLQENLPLTIDGLQAWMRAPSGNGVFETDVGSGNSGQAWITAGAVTDAAAFKATATDYTIGFSTDIATGKLQYTITPGTGATIGPTDFESGKAIAFNGASVVISGQPAVGDTFEVNRSTDGLNVFDTLDRAIATLSDASATDAEATQAVNFGLRDLDQAFGQLQWARSIAGETLNQLDGIDNRTQDRVLGAEAARSTAEDMDMIQAVSEFSNRQTSYQAALQSYSMVQKLSLFNYIGN